MTYRVLITGSRAWEDTALIHGVLNTLRSEFGPFTLVHGGAKGVDSIADQWGRSAPDVRVEVHPAPWQRCGQECNGKHAGRPYCPTAGMRRNRHMVTLGADVVLAFIRDKSRGATHCADLAEAVGLEVRRWTA